MPHENNRPRVLVVEDDPSSLKSMMRLLTENGYPVHGAAGYQDALDVFERERCDILISDIVLPDGSGLDLMRRLAIRGVRGIAFSALVATTDRRAALDAGFTAHVCKPATFSKILQSLDEIHKN